MEAPPLEQAAAASAPASSKTSASAPSLTPPPNPPTTGAATAVAAPLTSVFTTITPTPNTGTASNPAQTLEPPATNPATARPPAPLMRSPYTHLASPITMSSSSAHAGSGASASPASIPASSPATSATPRCGVVLGIPAPRPGQKHVSYTGLVPQPPLAHQFEPMHRRSDQSPSSPSQFRQPSPGIQNIVIVNSVSSSQMRPGLTSGPQQPSPGIPLSTTVTTPISSGSQMTGSQRPPARAITRSMSMSSPPLQQPLQNTSSSFRPQQRPQLPQPRPQQSASAPLHQQDMVSAQQEQRPQHQLLQQKQVQQQSTSHQNQQNAALRNQLQLSQQQAARAPVSTAQKPDIPSAPNVVMQSVDTITTDTDAGENGNRLVTKRSICELVSQIDPNEKLDPEVEDVLIDIAEDFVESVASFACSLAKHRKSDTLEAKDVLLHAEKSWNIILPGFSGDEIKLYKKQHVSDIHRERLSLVKKSMVSDTKAQAAANQKNQTPKPPAPGSP